MRLHHSSATLLLDHKILAGHSSRTEEFRQGDGESMNKNQAAPGKEAIHGTSGIV